MNSVREKIKYEGKATTGKRTAELSTMLLESCSSSTTSSPSCCSPGSNATAIAINLLLFSARRCCSQTRSDFATACQKSSVPPIPREQSYYDGSV